MPTPRRRMIRPVAALLPILAVTAWPMAAQEPLDPVVTEISPGEDVSVINAAISPDGRWIAYARMDSETSASIWVIPATGGEPVRLTSAGHWEDQPTWAPDGQRIYFRSNRAARAGDWRHYGMVLAFDPASGRTAGAPRQVTLDEISGRNSIQVSPDGRSLAYMTREGGLRIRVVPAVGGSARTIVELQEPIFNLRWSASGDALLYSQRPGQRRMRVAYRVPAEGGEPLEVFRTDKNIQAIGPDARTFAMMEPGPNPRERTIEVVRRDGRVLARHVGDANLQAWAFSKDGRALVGTATRVTAPIRVVPITGGRPVSVTDDAHYDWHAAWTADGSEVLVYTSVGDGDVIVAAPRTGGAPSGPPLPLPEDEEDASWSTVDEDFALYTAAVPGTERRRLVAVSRRDGSRQVLSENHHRFMVAGAGGSYGYLSPGEFLFAEARDDGHADLIAVRPGSSRRTLRSMPADQLAHTSFAVHRDRVAWFEEAGDSVRLLLSTAPATRPHHLLSLPAGDQCCRANLTFSRNGRHLLTQEPGIGGAIEGRMLLLDLAPDGSSVQRRRTFDTGAYYWYEAQWLPDDSGVTILAGYEGLRTHVVLVRFRDGEGPVIVTRDDPSPKWGQMLSPDGRYVAYPGEVWRGGSIWLMDLSPVAPVARR